MSMAKADRLTQVAVEMNKELPTHVWLNGDGTFWIQNVENKERFGRPATKEEILSYLYLAIEYGNQLMKIK